MLLTVLISFGANSGAALNPARDFGPRLFCWFAGYPKEIFSAYNYFFIIPIIGPILGGIMGGLIHKLI